MKTTIYLVFLIGLLTGCVQEPSRQWNSAELALLQMVEDSSNGDQEVGEIERDEHFETFDGEILMLDYIHGDLPPNTDWLGSDITASPQEPEVYFFKFMCTMVTPVKLKFVKNGFAEYLYVFNKTPVNGGQFKMILRPGEALNFQHDMGISRCFLQAKKGDVR